MRKLTLQDITDQRAYERERETQAGIAAGVSLISPSSATGRLIADLCGTSEADKQKYLDAIKSHQQTLENELFSQVKRTTLILPSGGTATTMEVEKNVDLKTLPAFAVQPAPLVEILRGNAGNLLSLIVWLIVPFALAYVRFLRYDVR